MFNQHIVDWLSWQLRCRLVVRKDVGVVRTGVMA